MLPMNMTFMGAGKLEKSIDTQHQQPAALRDSCPGVVIPFAAVDARHPAIVDYSGRNAFSESSCTR